MEPTLPRSRYVSSEAFQQEWERVFFRQWICVGRVEEILEAGDHLVCDVAGESVLVTRNRDGGLSGYYDLWRHRGSVLDPSEGKPGQKEIGPSGTFKGSIQCPYHAWTYSFDGRLRAAPYLDESETAIKAFTDEHLPTANGGVRLAKTCLYTLTPDRDFVIDRVPAPNVSTPPSAPVMPSNSLR